jgi:hypothetical protein
VVVAFCYWVLLWSGGGAFFNRCFGGGVFSHGVLLEVFEVWVAAV